MVWADRPQNYKDLYGILQLLQGSHLDNFPLKTLKLGWVAFQSFTFQLKCLDFQSNQYKKLAPVLSRFCNGLLVHALACIIELWSKRIVTALMPSFLFRCLSLFLPHLRTLAHKKRLQNNVCFGTSGPILCLYPLL